MVHIRFCMELYQLQAENIRYFLREHPASASSWAEPEVRRIMQMDRVQVATADQCQYEAQDKCGVPIKKPTRFMTNSCHIADALNARCSGRGCWCSRKAGGKHALCNGERAKAAATYQFALCRAILTSFRNQVIADGRLLRGAVGLNCVMLDGHEQLVVTNYVAGDCCGNVMKLSIAGDKQFVDDLAGQKLDPALCRAARQKEMDFVCEKGLWIKRTAKGVLG